MSQTSNLTESLIRTHLRSNYRPCDDYSKADLRLNTAELYDKLINTFPGTTFDQATLFNLMLEEGFSYADAGDLNVEWLLMRCFAVAE
jgi:hypothetical protein